jgi:membrane associated rhomboid family serine protease
MPTVLEAAFNVMFRQHAPSKVVWDINATFVQRHSVKGNDQRFNPGSFLLITSVIGNHAMQSSPETEEIPGTNRIFAGKPGVQLRSGIILMLFSCLGWLPLRSAWLWFTGGPIPETRVLLGLSLLLLFPLGILGIVSSLRGMPRLRITQEGVELESLFGLKWAHWDSVEPFLIKSNYAGAFRKEVQTATAKVVGPNASKGLLRVKAFSVPDEFQLPIADLVAEINAARVRVMGAPTTSVSSAIVPEQAPVGLEKFNAPWLSLGLLVVLAAIFTLENLFPVTPQLGTAPSIQKLFAFGALSRQAVFSYGEWYRLFTAPLLHANFAHIAGNGVALLLGGWLLERFVGRLWFFAFFTIGALGGSLGSLLIGPHSQISVGASGALMGLFAAMFIGSFRPASGTAARLRMQVNSLRVLIPSLLPQFSSSSAVHIDYAAHFGGALTYALAALLLLKSWPETERLPQRRTAAAVIVVIGAILFAASVTAAAINFRKYDVAMIPQGRTAEV